MSQKSLVVFTRKSKESLIRKGGTAAWALRPELVREFEYVVCARNTSRDEDDGSLPGPEPRGSAFLVGRISTIEFLYNRNNRDRYIVNFDAVAEVDVPDFWDGSRNPVRYMLTEEVRRRGIDFGSLAFESLENARRKLDPPEPRSDGTGAPARLTLAQAKRGLAATFDVSPDAIEIVIRA
ncbi:MAG TPA: hypothetical protein VFZ88_11200 [Sphingomicrobium sp.]